MSDYLGIRKNTVAPGVIRMMMGINDVLDRDHKLRFNEIANERCL